MGKKVALACTECLSRNYSTNKNTSETKRLEVRKFCKRCGIYTLHRETK
ncbi:50S ribosomal protein L33 [Aquibacillus rhizosphaerae]|uniref:Large ribosomal subunit protein bL33 n=1 Tax=Aquibacillus rhizosphaerae TaxID=3051431 RepID=A0ABT7L682_9BACI|nr:50S ribosomal protein L33 [Aquibacillus sp. LR5S19]MDL4841368.1 50S ribosomal protein L33 [Aquibacillus sp. LR5S19]